MMAHNVIGAGPCLFGDQRLRPLAWPLDGQRPFIPRAGCRDPTVILVATLRGGRRSGFAQVVALPSKSRSRPAGSLCGSA